MKLDLNNLPNDPNLLHSLIKDLAYSVDAQQTEIASHQQELRSQKKALRIQVKENKALSTLIDELKRQLAALNRARYGRLSEKLNPDQLALFEAELDENIAATKARLDALLPKGSKSTDDGAAGKPADPVPENLARETETIDLADPKCCTHCDGHLVPIGTEERELMEYRPATFVLKKIVRHKYVCHDCETIVTAPLPCLPIEKGRPGPSLLAHIMVSKYQDHLPLDRQATINRLRHGVHTPTSSLSDWVGRGSWALTPLYDLLIKQLLQRSYLHTDDTPVKVMVKDQGSKIGRLWIYLAPAEANAPPIAVYDYTPHRKQTAPFQFLQGFSGYLQADAYSGYNIVYRQGTVTEVGCWAHARRYFEEVSGDSTEAQEALAIIAGLYNVERRLRNADPVLSLAEVKAQRIACSAPLLEAFKQWLDQTLAATSQAGGLARAIKYTLNHWQALNRYLEEGHLNIDNNPAERLMRCIAVGRKNYLFFGSHAGGDRAAIIYSLIETCKANKIDPYEYLTDIFGRIANHPNRQLAELLPYNWKPKPTESP
jgi:transposase